MGKVVAFALNVLGLFVVVSLPWLLVGTVLGVGIGAVIGVASRVASWLSGSCG